MSKHLLSIMLILGLSALALSDVANIEKYSFCIFDSYTDYFRAVIREDRNLPMNDNKVRVRCHRLSNSELNELSDLIRKRSVKTTSDFCGALAFTPQTMAELSLTNTVGCRNNNPMDLFASVYQ